ncbi:hypothetical protein AX14_011828 [Amanita brunnescens Koide BX004]|nr:hypothetical protein AX14_011828 [Amanita brunnescens Koide BX004]
MPLEDFLRRQRTEDDSFSPEAISLPLPPPSAADFPPLAPHVSNPGPTPRKVAPKPTKAEKVTLGKINALLAPAAPAVTLPAMHHKAVKPASTAKTPEPPVQKILERPVMKPSPERTDKPLPLTSDPNTCAICRVSITCCTCQIMYTAPGTKRMRCSACLHWACDLDDSEACCSCGFPWIPKALPPTPRGADHEIDQGRSDPANSGSNNPLTSLPRPATRLYGGVPSVGSTEDDEDDSSASAAGDDTVRPVIPPTPPPLPMSSADEIDAFVQLRYDESRPTSAAAVRDGDTSSHYGFENKAIEDLTWSSTPEPAEAIPGYKHSDWPDAILQCDEEDAYHFVKRSHADISKIANDLNALMSGNTSWKTMFHAINDCFQFNTIRGSPEEFMCMLAALAKTWNDDTECRPLDILSKIINNASVLGRVSSRLGTANTALVHVRNEQNQACADRKALINKFLKEQDNYKAATATIERLHRQQNELKATLEDIRDAPDPLPHALADLQKHSDDVLDENKTLKATTSALTEEKGNLLEQLSERNEIIAAYECENAELTRKLGDSDILRVGMKGELDTAKAVIESMRKSMDAEKAMFEKQLARATRGTSVAAPSSGEGLAYQQQLESQLAAATKQIAYLDKAYKDKSASLKDALASQTTPSSNNKQSKTASSAAGTKSPKSTPKNTPKKVSKELPKWGFEPGTEQGSQPYWDHNNKFSEYITAMVSATVSTLPHIPLSSAIATAIGTVTNQSWPPSPPQ